VIRAWKRGDPQHSYYRLPRRDWALLPAHAFVFRTQHHKRLVRRDHAVWRDEMIVHEALPDGDAGALDATIEHRFATSVAARRDKEDLYALLWALRAAREGRKSKSPVFQRPAHVFRDAILKGALARGGSDGLALAVAVSRYHAQKYRYLQAIRDGAFASRVAAFDAGRYGELFAPLTEAEKESMRSASGSP
jgi:(heptosyl)LPS beta-1,4-glucosyltransferase